jgi:hypothetical protein
MKQDNPYSEHKCSSATCALPSTCKISRFMSKFEELGHEDGTVGNIYSCDEHASHALVSLMTL